MTALAERAVLVTGANRGMGREYVGQLLDRGARKVYAAARDPRTIDIDDSRVVPLQLDVTDAASVATAVEAATDVTVLINNAGITRGASVLDRDTSALRAELETNPFRRASDGLCIRRSDRRTVRGHRQCRVGTGVGAVRRELQRVQGGVVERNRLHAS